MIEILGIKCNIKTWLIKPNNKVNHEFLIKREQNDADFLYDDTSKIVCFGMKKNTFIKRLLLLFIPGGLIILIFYEDFAYSFICFPFIIFICSVILFINFPILVVRSKLRPIYFGHDLFIDREKLPYLQLKDKEKRILLNNIKWLLILLYSLLSAALSDYWLFKTHDTSSYFEIIGVTGGILKIFQLVAHMGAGYFLSKTRTQVFNTVRKKSLSDSNIHYNNQPGHILPRVVTGHVLINNSKSIILEVAPVRDINSVINNCTI